MIEVLLPRGLLATYAAVLLVVLSSSGCRRDKATIETKDNVARTGGVERSQPSRSVVITGSLVGPDESPVGGSGHGPCSAETAACIVVVHVKATRGEGANTEMDIAAIPGALGTEPNEEGRFSIEIDRTILPKGAQFLVATMGLLSGVQPLRLNDKPVVFRIDDKSETIDLGRITMKTE